MLVREAMRRQVVALPAEASIARCINQLLKFKSNALLVTGEGGRPAGVVSKTDLVSAFYAGMSVGTPLGDIMIAPVLTCFPDDELESSLDLMRTHGIHRLYVSGADADAVTGTLSTSDVVALLYRYCRSCDRGTARRPSAALSPGADHRLSVADVMSAGVLSFDLDAPLAEVVEGLIAHRFGAVLIRGAKGVPTGVISKTDLIRAYHHGAGLEDRAESVMSAPVVACDQRDLLWEALRYMFLKDVQRLFVHAGDPGAVAGALSLSDAVRVRSGSCRACTPSRFIVAG
jgi:CBS domain-containing protein